jgi:hypothetical protein
MFNPTDIVTLQDAKEACAEGRLQATLMMAEELGGEWRAENILYLPMHASAAMDVATIDLIAAVRRGMIQVHITPTYHKTSSVPTAITIIATTPQKDVEMVRIIEVWQP